MSHITEALNLAEKMAKRYGVRMCDENGDTHGEELYCVGIDDIADIIREARADHIAGAGKVIADTNALEALREMVSAQHAGPITSEMFTAWKKGKVVIDKAAIRESLAEPVKQKPVADYAYATVKEYEELAGFSVTEAFRAGWNMARTTNSMLGIKSTTVKRPQNCGTCYCSCIECVMEPATEEKACSDHPDAPHGFDRNASHNAGHYVCDCEGWTPEEIK